jgi:hypothetical protein
VKAWCKIAAAAAAYECIYHSEKVKSSHVILLAHCYIFNNCLFSYLPTSSIFLIDLLIPGVWSSNLFFIYGVLVGESLWHLFIVYKFICVYNNGLIQNCNEALHVEGKTAVCGGDMGGKRPAKWRSLSSFLGRGAPFTTSCSRVASPRGQVF